MTLWQRVAGVLVLTAACACPAFGQCPRADMNGDCRVGFEDLIAFADRWLDSRIYTEAGLVGWWRMEDEAGAVLADSSGYNRPGVLVNMGDPAWVSGKFGGGLEFDGVDDYVQITGYKGVTGTGPRTVTAWVRTSGNGVVVGWGAPLGVGKRFLMSISQGRLRAEVGGGYVGGSTIVNDGAWHHVAAASDGTGTGAIRLYVDGVPDTISGQLSQIIDTGDTDDVTIGKYGVTYLTGVVDDVRIYDRVLNDEEIAALGTPGADLDASGRVDMADLAIVSAEWREQRWPRVIINEIHHNPDVKTERVEFVELYNAGQAAADLSGWYFSAGIDLRFDDGVVLAPGAYLVVTEDAASFRQKFGFDAHAVFKGKLANEGEMIRLKNRQGETVDEVEYQLGFPWPIVGDPVSPAQPGTGRSIQLINPEMDNDLAGNWRSGAPTPAARNSVFAVNAAPQMRQLSHSPKSPRSGEPVTITVKVTDPQGVSAVNLSYQIVLPGQYIRLTDAAYTTNWTTIAMRDDGSNGDETAGDNVYTVVIPGSIQVHRRLIRYRITARDTTGLSITAPYSDDPCPNFAYFVYDGVPAWTAAINPWVSRPQNVTYGPEMMRSLPVYHLISSKTDVETATWLEKYQGNDYKWRGTLVYDGEVYDHISYRMRGGVWRYAMGKNMWKFDFNRGHYFEARDDYGEKYATTWDKLNLSACIQQGSFGQRGEHGMFEALTFRLFNLAGCPAPKTHWLHFRVIDEAHEVGMYNAAHPPITSSGTQYDGDFWGLYMAIEQVDGRFLDEHGLPDGNLYKMEVGYGEKNNQGPTQPADFTDIQYFKNTFESSPSQDWWVTHANLDHYYPMFAVYHACHHGDITHKNHFFYHNPEPIKNEWGTNYLWSQLPWDVDLTWTTYYGSMSDPWSRSGILNHSGISIRNKNFTRHFIDLMWGNDQIHQLIDEFAAIIDPPGAALSMVDADRAMWDYHWVMGSGAYPTYLSEDASFKAGQNRFYLAAYNAGLERSFRGMVQLMKNYATSRRVYMENLCADTAIPHKPTITYTGTEGYPVNDLRFSTGPYSDPQGSQTFAAMQWRIGEVAPFSQSTEPGTPVTLIPPGSTWRYFKGTQEASQPDVTAWRQYDFNDSAWPQGAAPIGWGESSSFLGTMLDGMQWTYTSFYVRKKFVISDLSGVGKATLSVMYDDGFNVWINNTFLPSASANMPGENVPFDGVANGNHDNESSWFTFDVPLSCLVEGDNIIAIQVHNFSRTTSSDCFVDASLTVEPASQEPPPVPPNYYRQRGKYEIEAVWESGELTQYQNSVRIPAGVVRPGRTYRARVRMKDNTNRWSHWSDPLQFVAGEPLGADILQNLRITEVMYNPGDGGAYDNDEYEFIELKNIGDSGVLDLSSVSFTDGILFDFAAGDIQSLAAGEFVLVVRNKAAFESRYGTELSSRIAGQYATAQNDQKLANEGEVLRLEDTWNGVITEFEYRDGRGWPLAADGGGHSLVPLASALEGQPHGSTHYGGNWRASAFIHGSPGADDPELPTTVVINEIVAHTDYFDPARPEYDSNDWIELYNTAGSTVALNGDWYLSDTADDLKKWRLPNVDLAAHAFVTFDEVSGFHNPISTGFGLNKGGEEVFLSYLPGDGTDRIVDCVTFKGQENFVSLGRYPDGAPWWFALPPTRDAANGIPYRGLVFSEIMYHPVDNMYEYIELHNPTGQTAPLYGEHGACRIDGGVRYAFPAGLSLGAGQRLVLVPFDPVIDVAAWAQFKADYNVSTLTPGVNVFGPYEGNLSNAGERIALEKPEPPDLPDLDIPWVIVDEVIYGDHAPWPEAPDGDGDALRRVSSQATVSGNDPTNWQAGAPSPGR